MDLEKIYSYIDANRDRYIELLQSFVRQPSVASMHPENEQMKELVMKTVREYTARGDQDSRQFRSLHGDPRQAQGPYPGHL